MSRTLEQQIYARAAELVGQGWVQYCRARNAKGAVVTAYAKTAVSFCAIGALEHAAYALIGDKEEAEIFLIKMLPDQEPLIVYNDSERASQDQLQKYFQECAVRSPVFKKAGS